MNQEIQIVPRGRHHMESFHETLRIVCEERKYLLMTEGPTLEQVEAFYELLVDDNAVQFVAVDIEETVVGWVDIKREPFEGLRHVGGLGMGILPEYRGQGIGTRLLQMAIEDAFSNRDFFRIELDAYASNQRAIRLYEKLGFETEGIKRKARHIDGEWDDRVMMALLKTP